MSEKKPRRRSEIYAKKQAETRRKHKVKNAASKIGTLISVILVTALIVAAIWAYIVFFYTK